jgi:hypothetical protein
MLAELWWGDLLKEGSLDDSYRNVMLCWTEVRFWGVEGGCRWAEDHI